MYKYLLVFAAALSFPSAGFAYQAYQYEFLTPYEIQSIDMATAGPQYFLGELSGFPEMYEIMYDATSTLNISIRSVSVNESGEAPFSGLLIRDQNGRGVEEIARLEATKAAWTPTIDPVSALDYFQGGQLEVELGPGTYRLEISTPDNLGKYILVLKDDEQMPGFGTTFSGVSATYEFYGRSKLGMLKTSVVFYPLGITLVMVLMVATWYWQRSRHKYA